MNKKLSRAQKNKLFHEVLGLSIAIIGVVILVCNFFKIVPENNDVITLFIAYGFLIGPVMAMLGIGYFLEVRDTKVREFSKKAR